jgi:hypothetical protein
LDIGQTFLDLLEALEIDIEACARVVMENSVGGVLYLRGNHRRLVFEQAPECSWRLGWEWVHDEEASGYLVVSEFVKLTMYWWSIGDYAWTTWYDVYALEPNPRFQRRQAAKARKELARLGLKQQPRSRMPGSWIH